MHHVSNIRDSGDTLAHRDCDTNTVKKNLKLEVLLPFNPGRFVQQSGRTDMASLPECAADSARDADVQVAAAAAVMPVSATACGVASSSSCQCLSTCDRQAASDPDRASDSGSESLTTLGCTSSTHPSPGGGSVGAASVSVDADVSGVTCDLCGLVLK